MINYYQPYLLPFLTLTPHTLPGDLRRTYFLSFEDALWVLLKNKNIPKHSVILVPDFYCMDVIINIRNHGFRPVYYPVDDNFQINATALNARIRTHAPAVVILFHACGLPCMDASGIKQLVNSNKDITVIEDAVHRLIEPDKVNLFGDNHYLIDSLRKVSPVPGSYIYWKAGSADIAPDNNSSEWKYLFSVHAWYLYFRALFMAATLMHNPKLILYAHERTLKAHDDIVGDSNGGYAGNPLIPHIHKHFHFAKVQKRKRHQVELYEKLLKSAYHNNAHWYPIAIPGTAKQELHVYPVGFRHHKNSQTLKNIEKELHDKNILVWFKFPDALWSKKRAVLFLPLGFHIRDRDIHYIARSLGEIISRGA